MYKDEDGLEFRSEEIANSWHEALREIILNLEKNEKGLYICPHCGGSPVSMPGYMSLHFKYDEPAFLWILEKAKQKDDYYLDSEGFKTSPKNWDRGLNLI